MRNVSVKDAGSRVASVVRELLAQTNGRRGLWQTRPLEPACAVGAPVAPVFSLAPAMRQWTLSQFSNSIWKTATDYPATGCEI